MLHVSADMNDGYDDEDAILPCFSDDSDAGTMHSLTCVVYSSQYIVVGPHKLFRSCTLYDAHCNANNA
jgi:hypothetical protein